jgi:O-antigen biosynthesis protein WbqP
VIYEKYVKRIIDIILSILGLVLLSPFFLLIAICIKIDSKGSVFFRQLRVGKDKREFNIYKFRTMLTDSPNDMPTYLLQNPEDHITRVGKFLRKTSLDELPQIINIIKGEMSIIGPRPVIRNEQQLFVEREKNEVYKVKPGLTGLAQVNGRDIISISDKAKLDGWYVKNVSFFLDLKIFLLTIVIVLKSEGVHEGVHNEDEVNSEAKHELVR